MTTDKITLSREELKELAKEITREVVAETLFDAGLRTDDPEMIEEARKDFAFVRKMRKSADGAASKIGWAILSLFGTGLLYALWTGFRVTVKGP